jgi:TPR repeat protein/Tol biopolymer transport system component
LAVLSAHSNLVESAAYSPDGDRIVTASYDKTVRIWDARVGARLAVLAGHGNLVNSAVYSPDGDRIVTASYDKTARIWDAHTGAQLAVLAGHGDRVYSAVYSNDGARIVTASQDKTARIWDAHTGAQLAVLSGHINFVESAAYSPDGTRIVTTSHDKTVRIWDARTGAQLAVLSGRDNIVGSAAYSPDGGRIITVWDDKTARIWDARTGAQLAVLPSDGNQVVSAAYSPDGTRIVTASDDATARVWDARIPAGIAAQIMWEVSAKTDPLPGVDRTQLGLPADSRTRSWPTAGSACDQAAAAVYDLDRLAPGASQANINADIANSACSRDVAQPEHALRSDYQMGRALLAKHDVKGAKRQFEFAVSRDYRAAGIDLANLLRDDAAGIIDPVRAIALYEKAWRDGVSIAAYELGRLYENGVLGSTADARISFQPDAATAWSWYQKGADLGEPNALARFAERDENNTIAENDPLKRNALLLQAFRFYAAAAERAYGEGWPDDAWQNWRYRRATLARLLAREGLMQQVADAYASVRDTWPAD